MSEMFSEGESSKRFRIYWCDINYEPYQREAKYDTIAEVRAHRYRLDRRYKISLGRKFVTRIEFEGWAKEAQVSPHERQVT